MLFHEFNFTRHSSYQSSINEINNSWINSSCTINSPFPKIGSNIVTDKRHELNDIIEFSLPINRAISQSLLVDWLFLLCDKDGNSIYSFNDKLEEFVGLICNHLTDNSSSIKRELLEGKTIELEMHSENCRLSESHVLKSIIIPILNYDHEIQSIMLYNFFNSNLLTDEIRFKILIASQQIQEYYYNKQYIYYYTNAILNGITECVLILDESYNIIHANNHCLDSLGILKYEFIGKILTDFLDKNDQRNISNLASFNHINFYLNGRSVPCSIINQQVVHTLKHKQLMLTFKRDSTKNPQRYLNMTVEPSSSFDNLAGEMPNMKKIITIAQSIAKKPLSILIEGESGTGKEVLAQAIHRESGRKGLFVPINCGALPKELLQSELFGYEEGTFTGGKKGGNIGKIELANNGTLFLDEIGEMPLDMQVSLLRVLQDKIITPLGGNSPRQVNVRIITATNKKLKNMVKYGNFREDLYYRINVMNIVMPPLRERLDDIPIIMNYILESLIKEYEIEFPLIDENVIEFLKKYHWPGNIRELKNVIEYALCTCQNNKITINSLPTYLMGEETIDVLKMDRMNDYERYAIILALRKYNGNITHAAKSIGVTRATLYTKLKKFEIDKNNLSKYLLNTANR